MFPTQNPLEITLLGRKPFNRKHIWSTAVRAINLVPQNRSMITSFYLDTNRVAHRDLLDTTVEKSAVDLGSSERRSELYHPNRKILWNQ